MKTKELFSILKEYSAKPLVFEYAPGKIVAANYHITEVKHVKIDSVDCGGQTDQWNETVIQLWESPAEIGKKRYMSSYKALQILNTVGKMNPYDLEAEVKFEYSNTSFHTAQLYVSDYTLEENRLMLSLSVKKTDCKAKELCGVPEPKVATQNSCEPGSGCC